MKTKPTLVALALSLLSMTAISSAQAAVITFDELALGTGATAYAPLAADYQGFNWSNFQALNTAGGYWDLSGYVPGSVSGDNVGFNGGGTTASFSSASAFTLNSFDLTAAWRDNLTVTVRGSGNPGGDYVATLTPSAIAATSYTVNWTGITSVTFEASGGTHHPDYGTGSGQNFSVSDFSHFAIDNITYNVSAVPEPESYAMLLAGLGALGFIGKRRRRQS